MTTVYITLDEAPEILQKKVTNVLASNAHSKLLSVTVWTSTPYKDKSIIPTRYTAFIQTSNYFESYHYTVCSRAEWTDREVFFSGMIAAEIIEFVKRCDWLQYGVSEALKEGAPGGTD